MLHAFIDESWDSEFFVLAGFVASESAWAMFSQDWESALREAPSIRYFKMNEVNGKTQGEFSAFSAEERREKILRLVRVINKHTSADFSVSVPVKYFNSLLVPALPKKFQYPYLWLFNGVLMAMASHESCFGDGRSIAFNLDEQQQFLSKAVAFYKSVEMLPPFNQQRAIVAKIEKGKDDLALPLQAADMLAWQVRFFLTSPRPKVMSPCIAELKGRVTIQLQPCACNLQDPSRHVFV